MEIDGHNAIPVRKIPFITGWIFNPDMLARALAGREGFYRVTIPSFHLSLDGGYAKILQKEWDTLIADLEILTNSLKDQEKHEDANYSAWRIESIKKLPPSAFVWKKDLKSAWKSYCEKNSLQFENERDGDLDLNLNPLIPDELKPYIYEGFEQPMPNEPPTPNLLPIIVPLLPRALDLAKFKPSGQPKIEPTNTGEPNRAENRFVLDGEQWSISYQGETVSLNNSKGLRYIAHLLRNPDKEILALDLDHQINPPGPGNDNSTPTNTKEALAYEENLAISQFENSDDILDFRTIKETRAKIVDLKDEIEDAKERLDTEKQILLQEEKEKIEQYLLKNLDLKGESRKTANRLENARKAVSACITRDIKKLEKHLPYLGSHLDQTIQKGSYIKYSPNPPVLWKLSD